MTDDRAVLGVIAPLRGMAAWGVRVGWGSFLTMEFGAPPAPPASPRSVDARPRGEWHLWINHAAWRLERDGHVIAASGDERGRLTSAETPLEDRKLGEVDVSWPVLDTVLRFEGGYSLRVFPCASVGRRPLAHDVGRLRSFLHGSQGWRTTPGTTQGQFARLAVRIFADLGDTFVDRIAAAFSEAPPSEAAIPARVEPRGLVVQRVAAIWPPIVAWSEAMAAIAEAGN